MGNICAACGHDNAEGMKFCGECGASLEQAEVTCPSCGHVNAAGIKFCGECGTPLSGEVAPSAEATVTPDKDTYKEGDQITVSVTGITEKMQSESAFVAIYKAGADHNDWGAYKYPQPGDSDLTFDTQIDGGDYEIRLYSREGQYDDTTMIAKAEIKVEGPTDDDVEIELDKESYDPGEQITATVKGISGAMQSDRAFVGVYKAGAGHGEWGDYLYPSAGESQQVFTAPTEIGDFELRLYRKDGQYDDSTLVKSTSFSVGAGMIKCPACGYNNPEGTKFCNECGAKLEPAQNCPACGAALTPGLKFCGECGEKL